jgi:mono/diheme cytochrome c family protein
MISRLILCVAVLLVSLCAWTIGTTESVRAQGPDLGTDAQRESGKTLYLKYCVQCHGEKGDGDGYATQHLFPRPRDFTSGKFKVRTTPNGALPTHQDLINIIRRGMPYTSMPGWPDLSDSEVSDLAYYLKTFSPDFAVAENVPKPMELPSGPAATSESIELGKKAYEENGCLKCHGTLGRGDGPSASTLIDDLGHPIRAADLTQPWTFRGGPSREDIFRTMTTGLNGTPMPSFADALTPEQRWAITDFITSLSSGSEPEYTNLVVAKYALDPIDMAKGTASFESAPVARFAIVGQIMEPGRQFNPPATSVTVQAIYDSESIAFLVKWHDMAADRTGKNDPLLPVPAEEEQVTRGAPAGSPAGGVFGDQEVQTPAAAADPFAEPAATTAAPPSEFSDAVSIQIPTTTPTSARKPYFIFGDPSNAVDLWFFDLARSEPLQFTGRGSTDIAPNDTGDVTGAASYDQGEWSVIFKRPLRASAGAPFVPGEFLPIALSVWDGFSRDRGNRRGLTAWYSVYMEPQVVPSALGPMVRTALIILVIELAVIGWVRWRHRQGTRGGLSHPAVTRA